MKAKYVVPLTCLGFTSVSSLQMSIFGTALPLIVSELNIDYSLVGILMALWTLIAALAPLIIGRYVDRLNPLTVMVAVMLISLLSSLLTALSTNLFILNMARVLLSLSIPFAWPTCTKIIARYMSGENYGYSTAVFNTGSMAGLAFSYITMALARDKWRCATIVAGLLALMYIPIIVAVWKYTIKGGFEIKGGMDRQNRRDYVHYPDTFQRDVVKISLQLFLAHFCALYTWSLLVNWLSTFLVNELRFSYSYIAIYMLFIYIISSILEVLAGIYSDRIGGSKGRLTILYVGLTTSSVLLLSTVLVESPLVAITLISLSVIMWRISTPSFWSIINDIIPLSYLGRVSYVYVSAAPLSGIASSIANGYIVSATGSIKYGVLISSILLLLSPMIYTAAARLGYRWRAVLMTRQM
ncbi:MAG: MFS transporter [Ignisphaera sp.]|nr:MFS transporter [Ignisphaera sp.]MCX8168418.1 MFS transporter [Ignisphaera sp.]MDW8086215.1 MFS transporter [Ignisphaera sp.]